MTGRFGDESYAKEELRAEIGSLMLGDELQIGHEFGQHAAYVDHWVKVLQDDPKEILRASRDAEKIQEFVMELEVNQQNYELHSKVSLIENRQLQAPSERLSQLELD